MTSCAPTLSSVNPDGAKRIAQAAFKPITWSAKDTAPTVRQIKVHNEVGVELGLWKAPKKKSVGWFRRTVKPKPVAPKSVVQQPDPDVWPPLAPPNIDEPRSAEPPAPPSPSPKPAKKKHWWNK